MKTRLAIASLCTALILPFASALYAQEIPDAPIPAQILTAKKVFISNGGEILAPNSVSGDSRRDYNQFYAAVKAWGHYDLVGSPAEADLVLQTSTYYILDMPVFRVTVLDPKTNVVLWVQDEFIVEKASLGLFLKKNRDKLFTAVINKLVDDLKEISTLPAAAK